MDPYLILTQIYILFNLKYTFFQGQSTRLTWKNGLWYGALFSSEHTISAELVKDVPFTGADLTVIQAQEVSSSNLFFGFNW